MKYSCKLTLAKAWVVPILVLAISVLPAKAIIQVTAFGPGLGSPGTPAASLDSPVYPFTNPYGDYDGRNGGGVANFNTFLFQGFGIGASGTALDSPPANLPPSAVFGLSFTAPNVQMPNEQSPGQYIPILGLPGGSSYMWIAGDGSTDPGVSIQIAAMRDGAPPFPFFGTYQIAGQVIGSAYFSGSAPVDMHIQLYSASTIAMIDSWIHYNGGGAITMPVGLQGLGPILMNPRDFDAKLTVSIHGGPAALYLPGSADVWISPVSEQGDLLAVLITNGTILLPMGLWALAFRRLT